MHDAAANRRRSRRYSLDVPVRVGEREARTRDVSSCGLYFVGAEALRVGSTVQLELRLPHGTADGPLDISACARVVRVDDLGGVAAEIESWLVLDTLPQHASRPSL